jgi:hypothetical protein
MPTLLYIQGEPVLWKSDAITVQLNLLILDCSTKRSTQPRFKEEYEGFPWGVRTTRK